MIHGEAGRQQASCLGMELIPFDGWNGDDTFMERAATGHLIGGAGIEQRFSAITSFEAMLAMTRSLAVLETRE